MPAAPHCVRCGREHFRFVRCTDVDAWNDKHAEKRAKKADPVIQNRTVPAGFRVWAGNKTPSYDVRGNVWYLKGGDNGPPEAA
jgi:hypothetical protein